MNFLHNLLPVKGVAHHAEELAFVQADVLQDMLSQHSGALRALLLLLEEIGRCREMSTALEAPVAYEGRAYTSVDISHSINKAIDDLIF